MYSLSTFRLCIYVFFVSFIEYTNSVSIFSYDYYLLSIRHVKGICVERICKYKFPYELIKSIDINWKNLYHETVTSFLENQWLKHGSVSIFLNME